MYIQDISRVFSSLTGQHGVEEAAFKAALTKASAAATALKAEQLPLLQQVLQDADLGAIEQEGKTILGLFSTVVVCGMGGSSLSGKMLAALTLNPFTLQAGKTRLLFLDNIDPDSMQTLLDSVDFPTTLFLLISKSGGTAETLTHAGILFHAAEAKLGKKACDHFRIITEPKDNPLQRLAASRGIASLAHDPSIGGRYAALTNVGLLPAYLAGLDIRAIRKGAASVVKEAFVTPAESAPVQGAVLSYLLAEQGKNVTVIMPYCDRLHPFAMWHRQIWAESLGKDGKGLTPAPALGSVDQHSQQQLYLDGPRDKFFTLLLLDQKGKGPNNPAFDDPSVSYLDNHPIGDLIYAHQHATVETLCLKHCPTRVLSLAELNAETLGALTMHFMLETILTARLMGIDPFNQPAVEDSKKLAIKRLTSLK